MNTRDMLVIELGGSARARGRYFIAQTFNNGAGPPCETEFLTFEFKTVSAPSNTPDKERT